MKKISRHALFSCPLLYFYSSSFFPLYSIIYQRSCAWYAVTSAFTPLTSYSIQLDYLRPVHRHIYTLASTLILANWSSDRSQVTVVHTYLMICICEAPRVTYTYPPPAWAFMSIWCTIHAFIASHVSLVGYSIPVTVGSKTTESYLGRLVGVDMHDLFFYFTSNARGLNSDQSITSFSVRTMAWDQGANHALSA
jgi:hypothetical protein